jgi:hypothetical protein
MSKFWKIIELQFLHVVFGLLKSNSVLYLSKLLCVLNHLFWLNHAGKKSASSLKVPVPLFGQLDLILMRATISIHLPPYHL